MFGYVRPHKAELLVREYEQYKAVYCELCRELGKSFGIGARMTLSYDCTFYAMLALALSDSQVHGEQKRCTVNPTKRCSFLESDGGEYKKAAALSIVMTYHKFKDNAADEKRMKAFTARIGAALLSRKYKKAKRLYPFIEQTVTAAMEEQQTAEREDGAAIDRCCEPTAKMLSALLAELAGEEDQGRRLALSEFGYYLGRWVYTMDAADDLADDLRSASFNPFIKALSLEEFIGKKKDGEPAFEGDKKTQAEISCNEVLNRNIARMVPAFHLLSLHRFETIIDNIIKKGLPEIQREVLFLHIKEKNHDRSV